MAKNIMSGGYTAQEARNLLLIRGIEHVKGIIPHNVPKNANLSAFEDFELEFDGDWWEAIPQFALKHERTGQIHGIRCKVNYWLCNNCLVSLQDYVWLLSPSLWVVAKREFCIGVCEFCGKGVCDDIPF